MQTIKNNHCVTRDIFSGPKLPPLISDDTLYTYLIDLQYSNQWRIQAKGLATLTRIFACLQFRNTQVVEATLAQYFVLAIR